MKKIQVTRQKNNLHVKFWIYKKIVNCYIEINYLNI